MADVAYDAVLGGLTLRQVRRSGVSPGIQLIAARASGAVAPSAFYVDQADARATFESMDVAGVIGGLSMQTGLFVSGGTLVIPWNRRANGGTFAGTLSHFTVSAATGLVIPKQFSAQQNGGGAVASLEVAFLSSDGLTSPIASNVNQTLAAQAYNVLYDLGPLSVNSVQVPRITGVTVNPGLTVAVRRYDGAVWPTEIHIERQDPTIDITFEDFDTLNSYLNGAAITAVAAYFRKRAPGSTYVAAGTAQHVKFSFTAGMVTAEDVSAEQQNAGQATLRLTGASLAASATQAIAL